MLTLSTGGRSLEHREFSWGSLRSGGRPRGALGFGSASTAAGGLFERADVLGDGPGGRLVVFDAGVVYNLSVSQVVLRRWVDVVNHLLYLAFQAEASALPSTLICSTRSRNSFWSRSAVHLVPILLGLEWKFLDRGGLVLRCASGGREGLRECEGGRVGEMLDAILTARGCEWQPTIL